MEGFSCDFFMDKWFDFNLKTLFGNDFNLNDIKKIYVYEPQRNMYNLLLKNITQNKKVCVVSSELHKRNHIELWEFLKLSQLHTLSGIILCTDLPIQAKHYFYE